MHKYILYFNFNILDLCGNGLVDHADEGCDDGNTIDGNIFSFHIYMERGRMFYNLLNRSRVCLLWRGQYMHAYILYFQFNTLAPCGNGKIDHADEDCDDGNTIDGNIFSFQIYMERGRMFCCLLNRGRIHLQ